jgi:dTDP-4-amino-4,6-dideoxygalactose transaminase
MLASIRGDEIQAAMLRVKLSRLEEMTVRRRKLADAYFAGLPARLAAGAERQDRDPLSVPPTGRMSAGILAGDWPLADELHAIELSLPHGHNADHVRQVCETFQKYVA